MSSKADWNTNSSSNYEYKDKGTKFKSEEQDRKDFTNKKAKREDPEETAIIRRGHLFSDVPVELKNKQSFETAIGGFPF